jgi:predicted MFS family arabinose efflux permease
VRHAEREILNQGVGSAPRPGTARSALSRRDFRLVFAGLFASNIGNWMQTTILGAYAYELTRSSAFVGLLVWCQLSPQLFLAPTGGVLADTRDRRRLMLVTQLLQLLCSLALMVEAAIGDPARWVLLVTVIGVGVANGLGAPAQTAIQYSLVPRADIAGVAALQNIQLNLSRVVGPPVGALLYSRIGPASVFGVNAATFVFSLAAVLFVAYPRFGGGLVTGGQVQRLLSGFRLARADGAVWRLVVLMFVISLLVLPFIGLMPVLADENFGIGPRSVEYGALLAVFGVGAALGATADGSVFAAHSKMVVLRWGFLGFGLSLGTWALVRSETWAFVVAFVVGFTYFLVITPLSTMFQVRLEDANRGRLMAVWMMAFGGTVPFGALIGGWVADRTSITAVVVVGAAVSLALVASTRERAPVAAFEPSGRVA